VAILVCGRFGLDLLLLSLLEVLHHVSGGCFSSALHHSCNNISKHSDFY